MGGRAGAHTPTHIASPRTCRSRTRSAPTAACRRKREPASVATPPTIPVCPTAFALPSQSHSPPALLVRRTANQTQADFVNGLLRQAATASKRHQEQTNADRQRRITESFSKAVEQLGNDKLELRIGGIYTLERISKESPDDYWTVMETLTAFVRERARWKEPDETVAESMARFYAKTEEEGAGRSKRKPSTD